MTQALVKSPLMALTENLIAVDAAANERLLAEARKTAAVKTAEAEQAKNVIAEQAKEIAALKGRFLQLEAEKEQEEAALRSAHAAEIVSYQGRIAELSARVDNFASAICSLAAILFNPHISGPTIHVLPGTRPNVTRQDLINARGIIHWVNNNFS